MLSMSARACVMSHRFVLISKMNSLRLTNMNVRSFKVKKSQKKKPKMTNSDRALEHFDIHYRPLFKNEWPSIRIALLTGKKSCAIMNDFASANKFYDEFSDLGATDIIAQALIKQSNTAKHSLSTNNYQVERKFMNLNTADECDTLSDDADDCIDTIEIDQGNKANVLTEEERRNIDRTNLYSFVPTKRVYSEKEQLRTEEAKRNVYTPMDVQVDIIKPRKISIPTNLTVMAFPPGNITPFPAVKADTPCGYLCHFMLDAASLLPVIALDLEDGDNVLDLCAAPGGKSLAILQTGLPGGLTCNDLSGSRIKRLRNILSLYIPEKEREHVVVKCSNALAFQDPVYDKVLVDVPCNTDRHSLLQDDNNLFCIKRINERIEMPKLQKDLLIAGIKSCRPGGCVVYSTCTLSAAQNEGVIQDTLDELWRKSNIDIIVEDLSEMTNLFSDVFRFHRDCRFGQLAVPSLSSNFGPMYFCRLRRVS